jgi:hypothetical protein
MFVMARSLTDASPLQARVTKCRKSESAISKSGAIRVIPLFNKRAFSSPKLYQEARVHTLAYISPTSSGGVTASLFNHNLLNRKRRANKVLVHRSYAGNFQVDRTKLFMGESSSTILDQQKQGEVVFASASDVPSRSQLVIQSLQGGDSTVDDCYKGNGINVDEVVLGGSIAANNVDENGFSSNDDKETNERDSKVSIHIYPCDDVINATISLNEGGETVKNINQLYNNAMLIGVGVSRRQFALGVYYHLNRTQSHLDRCNKNSDSFAMHISSITSKMLTLKVDYEKDWEAHRSTLLQFWKEEQLICCDTTLLSPKMRRTATNHLNDGKVSQEERVKYEAFRVKLSSEAEQMVGIMEDELSDVHNVISIVNNSGGIKGQSKQDVPKWNSSRALLGWIEQEYGAESTTKIMASSLLKKSEGEQLKVCMAV